MPVVFDMSDPLVRQKGLAAAVTALRAGQLVAFPTETVYGLGADARQPEAVAAVYRAKGRPSFNPLIVHVANLEDASDLAVMAGDAQALAAAFWPGPLTLVLNLRHDASICEAATAGLDTVAIRVPAERVARELLQGFGGPVVGPSANRSGRVSATTADHVAADLGDSVAVILDIGPCALGIESAIVSVTGQKSELLRPGAIARSDLEQVLGAPLVNPAQRPAKVQAPGMLASHYAPRASVRLDARWVEPGEAFLGFGGDIPAHADQATAFINLSPAGDLAEAAASLFGALRKLDENADAIAVAPIPDTGLGEAINDRLRRAAAPRS
jgi:L-threonylcarbamoyladenylate synthase